MDPDKKKLRLAKLRAFVALQSPEKLHYTRKRAFCSCCSWLKFGIITLIVMICLGTALLVVGGVLIKIDVLILGCIFIVGSFVFFCVIVSPYRGTCKCCQCWSSANRVTDTVIEETPEVKRPEPKPVPVMLEKAGKRLSFRSALHTAIQNETSPRHSPRKLSSSTTKTFDKSWMKMVESQRAKEVIKEESSDNLKSEADRGDKRQVDISKDSNI